MMKAIVRDTYGSADVLELADVTAPGIGDGEVLIRVHAAGVGPDVWHLMTGQPYLFRMMGVGLRKPRDRVLGRNVAGTVEAVGKDVTQLEPGDEVFGVCDGAFAEYARARADEVAPKSANLTFEQAAAVPISGCAALHGLRDAGEVQAGQKVLIIGASGGVGTFAVQIAKASGAEVTGVCSTTKVEMVRSIGADHVIDYTQEDFADGSQRYDLILDTSRETVAVSPAPRPHPARDARDRWRRRRRAVARGFPAHGPQGAPVVAFRGPEAARTGLDRAPGGPAFPQCPHRIRQGDAGNEQNVPARRGFEGSGRRRRGTRARKGRDRRGTKSWDTTSVAMNVSGTGTLSLTERIRTRIEHEIDTRSVRLAATLIRLTKGRIARLWRRRVLLLTTRGRRSGKERTVPLQFFPDGEDMLVVAANSGLPSPPGWYFNLTTEPTAWVEVGGRTMRVRAEELSAEETADFWERVVLGEAPEYARYPMRTSRRLPMIRLASIGSDEGALP